MDYFDKITEVLDELHQTAVKVLPGNRALIETYVDGISCLNWILAGAKKARRKCLQNYDDEIGQQFQDYIQSEEDRLNSNLKRIQYQLDSTDTVNVVLGKARLEEVINSRPIVNIFTDGHRS